MHDFAESLGMPEIEEEVTIYVYHNSDKLVDTYHNLTGESKDDLRRIWADRRGYSTEDNIFINASTLKMSSQAGQIYVAAHELNHFQTYYLYTSQPHGFRDAPYSEPTWLFEGIATFLGWQAVSEGGVISYETVRKLMQEALESAEPITLKEIETLDDFLPHGGNSYFYSMLAVELLASYEGQSSLMEFYTSLEPGTTWEQQFENIFGMSVDDFYGRFEEHEEAGFPDPSYYTQFITTRGVTIKAPDQVDPEALRVAANIVALMLDGRKDIADCIGGLDSGFAIFPKDRPVTDLPEFSYLRGQKDMWGRAYESGFIYGLGGVKSNPVSAASEQSLIPIPQYPNQGYWVAVHEFAHHLMNLCFSENDYAIWERLHRETREADLGYGEGLMVNVDEFFAGVSTAYFSIHDTIPRRRLDRFPSEILERLEEFYGALTTVETDAPGYIRYVSGSGASTPWVMAAGGAFEHGTFGYRIDLLPGWKVEREEDLETLLKGPSTDLRIKYTLLPPNGDSDDELMRLAESSREGWERWTRGWDKTEVKSFERESSNGQASYWIRYYGHESPRYCDIDVVERVLIVSHEGRRYGVVLQGLVCGGGQMYKVRDVRTILRSFDAAAAASQP